MRGRPDIVALPKVAVSAHVARLDEAVTRFERDYGIPQGTTTLLPKIPCATAVFSPFPLTAAHWYRDRQRFRPICKACTRALLAKLK